MYTPLWSMRGADSGDGCRPQHVVRQTPQWTFPSSPFDGATSRRLLVHSGPRRCQRAPACVLWTLADDHNEMRATVDDAVLSSRRWLRLLLLQLLLPALLPLLPPPPPAALLPLPAATPHNCVTSCRQPPSSPPRAAAVAAFHGPPNLRISSVEIVGPSQLPCPVPQS